MTLDLLVVFWHAQLKHLFSAVVMSQKWIQKRIIGKIFISNGLEQATSTGGVGYSNPGLIRKSLLATRPSQSY